MAGSIILACWITSALLIYILGKQVPFFQTLDWIVHAPTKLFTWVKRIYPWIGPTSAILAALTVLYLISSYLQKILLFLWLYLYRQINKLFERIDNSLTESFSGVYLITGFRGMGKTSLVKHALNSLRNDGTINKVNHKVIEMDLSQNDVDELSILKSLVWNVYDKYTESIRNWRTILIQFAFIIFILSVGIAVTNYLYGCSYNIHTEPGKVIKEHVLLVWQGLSIAKLKKNLALVTFLLATGSCYFLLRVMHNNLDKIGIVTHKSVLKRLSFLNKRVNATVVKQETLGLKQFDFKVDLGGTQQKYDSITAKEIEYELIQILHLAEAAWMGVFKRRFIFIFDELDKIQPHYNPSLYSKQEENTTTSQQNKEGSTTQQLRRRKEKIEDILGSLKLFFNSANAKFFFIAGSEMNDAALADSTERESFLGSIFHDVIYVPSFYSDFNNQTSDITWLSEEYLCNLLTTPNERASINGLNQHESRGLKCYYKHLKNRMTNDPNSPEIDKTIFVLQNFVIYLTNRSNGSPKKMIKLIEDHIVTNRHIESRSRDNKGHNGIEDFYFISGRSDGKIDKRFYLHFDELSQYKLGFTTYLFTPFLYTHSIYMTNHSDKLLVSSSFLLDHLYKFHSHGFSKSNLELTPELISYSKVPELRMFMDSMFNSITQKHIREIFSGLYDFRFQSNITDEITFLSRVLQLESAVYNFTLDESLELKKYYLDKLDDYRETYQGYKVHDQERHPFVLGFINSLIGDLHFYDQEYDNAIIHYDNALKTLSYLESHNFSTMRYFVAYMLKLGLVYEKIRDYSTAYVIYKRAHYNVMKYMNSSISSFDKKNKKEYKYYLRLFFQPIVCRLTVVEKSGLSSVLESDVQLSISEFQELYNKLTDKDIYDDNILIESQFYNKLGNLLFYKNSSTSSTVGHSPADKITNHFLKEFDRRKKKEIKKKLRRLEGDILKIFDQIKIKPPTSLSDLAETLMSGPHGYKLASELVETLLTSVKEEVNIALGLYTGHHDDPVNFHQKDKKELHQAIINYIGQLSILNTGPNSELPDTIDSIFARCDDSKPLKDHVRYQLINETVNAIHSTLKVPLKDHCNNVLKGIQGNLIKKRYPDTALSIYIGNIASLISNLGYSIADTPADLKGLLSNVHELVHSSLNKRNKEYHLPKNVLLSISNYLSKLGNTLICYDLETEDDNQDISGGLFQANPLNGLKDEQYEDIPFRYAIVCFWLSSKAALAANHPKKNAFELTKMLYTVKNYIANGKIGGHEFGDKADEFLLNVRRYHIKPILISLNKANHGTRRIGIHDYNKIQNDGYPENPIIHMNLEENEEGYHRTFEAAPNSAETKEVILLYQEIELKAKGRSGLPRNLIDGYTNVNNQFNRIAELIYKSNVNYMLYNYLIEEHNNENLSADLQNKLVDHKLLDEDHKNSELTEEEFQEVRKTLIFDSIYCLVEIIKTRKVFGITYIHNHSNLANTHEKLAYWCGELHDLFQQNRDDGNAWHRELEKLINRESLRNLDAEYHDDQALENYYSAIKMHTENENYNNNLQNMYYLEDDFDDELVHFCAALERLRLNSGYIYQKVMRLKDKLHGTKIHDVENFVPTSVPINTVKQEEV